MVRTFITGTKDSAPQLGGGWFGRGGRGGWVPFCSYVSLHIWRDSIMKIVFRAFLLLVLKFPRKNFLSVFFFIKSSMLFSLVLDFIRNITSKCIWNLLYLFSINLVYNFENSSPCKNSQHLWWENSGHKNVEQITKNSFHAPSKLCKKNIARIANAVQCHS